MLCSRAPCILDTADYISLLDLWAPFWLLRGRRKGVGAEGVEAVVSRASVDTRPTVYIVRRSKSSYVCVPRHLFIFALFRHICWLGDGTDYYYLLSQWQIMIVHKNTRWKKNQLLCIILLSFIYIPQLKCVHLNWIIKNALFWRGNKQNYVYIGCLGVDAS